MTMAEFCAAVFAWLWPQATKRVTQVKPDLLPELRSKAEGDATSARIRAYMALTMVERYGEQGPP
jgi:hypothetical protein